jgi:hypothetical protein
MYIHFKDKTIHTLPWLEELRWFRVIEARCETYNIFDSFK